MPIQVRGTPSESQPTFSLSPCCLKGWGGRAWERGPSPWPVDIRGTRKLFKVLQHSHWLVPSRRQGLHATHCAQRWRCKKKRHSLPSRRLYCNAEGRGWIDKYPQGVERVRPRGKEGWPAQVELSDGGRETVSSSHQPPCRVQDLCSQLLLATPQPPPT